MCGGGGGDVERLGSPAGSEGRGGLSTWCLRRTAQSPAGRLHRRGTAAWLSFLSLVFWFCFFPIFILFWFILFYLTSISACLDFELCVETPD